MVLLLLSKVLHLSSAVIVTLALFEVAIVLLYELGLFLDFQKVT
jgi:hypothetical protein